jgi:hypothetical protein
MSQSRSPIAAAEAQQVGQLEEIPAHGPIRGLFGPHHHAGGSARGVPGALRVPEPQRQDYRVVQRPRPTGSSTGAQPRGSTPPRTFAVPTSSGSSCTAPSGLRAQHRARVRAGPEDPVRLGHRLGYISEDITGDFEMPRLPKTIIPTFSDGQLHALLAVPTSGPGWVSGDRALLLVLLDTLIYTGISASRVRVCSIEGTIPLRS